MVEWNDGMEGLNCQFSIKIKVKRSHLISRAHALTDFDEAHTHNYTYLKDTIVSGYLI